LIAAEGCLLRDACAGPGGRWALPRISSLCYLGYRTMCPDKARQWWMYLAHAQWECQIPMWQPSKKLRTQELFLCALHLSRYR